MLYVHTQQPKVDDKTWILSPSPWQTTILCQNTS